MPVSHLGLVVSHIPSATSFYLATLRPLGYRFVGQDGATIGIGVDQQADLFLTQEPAGRRPALPTHIAFDADSRSIVRECYTAALNAGAYPSGSPGYCNEEATVFNAAVEDLDGNTLEFIYKDPAFYDQPSAESEDRLTTWHDGVARSGLHDTSSRSHTALDLASATPPSMRQRDNSPSPGLTRSRTEPAPTFPKKAVFGTILGAAAGAAFAWAMTRSERDNARDEDDYNQSSRRRASRRHSDAGHTRRSLDYDDSRRHHRNYSTTETQPDYSPRLRRSQRTIEPSRHDDEYRDYMSRYIVHRRLKGPDDDKPVPASDPGRSSRHSTKHSTPGRSERKHYYIEAPPAQSSSRRSTAHRSTHSQESNHRRDSGVSVTSHRSHRSHRSRHEQPPKSESNASTIKASRQAPPLPSAAEVPLPASRKTSVAHTSSKSRHEVVDDGGESDGLGDYRTVVPDDSISCVDFSKRNKRSSTRSYAPESSRRKERGEERRSAVTLPARSRRGEEMAYYLVREDGGRERERERERRRGSHA